MKKVLLVSIASFVLFSCELFEQPYSTSRVDNEKNISYSKSKDDALNELCSFLGVTKSDMEINSIEVIYGSGLTKSGNSDSLLFLINLNSGYAVIAADKRIPENILMFSENGEATPEMFYGQPVPIDSVTTYNNNYYNSTYDDYYVGSEPAHPESFIMEMVYQYAQAAVTTHNGIYGEYDTPDDSLRLIDGTTLDVYPIRKNIRTYTVTKVNSMMNTLWMQSDPYNSYVPNDKPAGCVPVAIAQIMTYNKYPDLYINGTHIDWDLLAENKTIQPNTPEAEMVALLIRHIQVECLSVSDLFSDDWTFTLPLLAKNFLADKGYNVNFIKEYNESALLSALTNDTPVFIAGMQDYMFWKSHGWVIDGWKQVFEQFDVYDKYTGDLLYSNKTLFKNHMVHCNWGNRDEAWVTSGAFRYYDSTYNTWFRLIIYDKPL